ncbi:MAG: alpha/beta hydrolase [Minwuia sp.]|nr:alpha/beta hydrolase [Minwuia sp.]
MPVLEREGARIHYETQGEGFPLLLLASGGMRSSIPYWGKAPWNPLARAMPGYRLIAMDQRNAGQSTAPITAANGWQTYLDDQIALLDHLGIDRFHVAGMCIGGSFIMELVKAIPDRVMSGVMLQPIGFSDNQQTFLDMFDDWAMEQRPDHPTVSDTDWSTFRHAMFGSEDLLFNATEADVAACRTPLLVLMGQDVYHPEFTSRRIVECAPDATLIEQWKGPGDIEDTHAAIMTFLAAHTPPASA